MSAPGKALQYMVRVSEIPAGLASLQLEPLCTHAGAAQPLMRRTRSPQPAQPPQSGQPG